MGEGSVDRRRADSSFNRVIKTLTIYFNVNFILKFKEYLLKIKEKCGV